MWGDGDAAAARDRGWEVDEAAGCIRAVPGGPHASDARAQAVVARLAMARNALAVRAWVHLYALTEPARPRDGHGLCMVEAMPDGFPVAYFTRRPVEAQWGDGWGMPSPRDNAGPPYGFGAGGDPLPDVVALRFSCPLLLPWDLPSTPPTLSVDDVNRGAVAWLSPVPGGPHAGVAPVRAGTGVAAFEEVVTGLGGWVEPFPAPRG